jgi:hypothetical protein
MTDPEAFAAPFARLALGHVTRAYPNKLDHVLESDADAQAVVALHPVFYGSYDWHSCVHGYWLLCRILSRWPHGSEAARITALFDQALTPEKLAGETAYLARPASAGFERPYGWAWALKLAAELEACPAEGAAAWRSAFRPLAAAFAERFKFYLPKADYPVRTGVHSSSAFALRLALDYAQAAPDEALEALIRVKARSWHLDDAGAPAWEPSQEDFLSPTLMTAEMMRRVLEPQAFSRWFGAYLPDLEIGRPAAILTPARVSDRSDGKIAHLDGLNFSRAWCLAGLAGALEPNDVRRAVMIEAAHRHLSASLPHVAGDYMGEHWLATFALLALEALEADGSPEPRQGRSPTTRPGAPAAS